MITLTSEYQYLGRSNAIAPYGTYTPAPGSDLDDIPKPPVWNDPGFRYYILLYGKTTPDTGNGSHRVSVKMRLVCTADYSFTGYGTTASAAVAGTSAFAWDSKQVPAAYWGNSPSITEDGKTYRRWVDLKEGTVEVDTGYEESEIDISASWRRNSISSDPPYWLPNTSTATVATTVLLSSFAPPEVPEQPTEPVSYAGTQVYADDALVYDSKLEELDLVALRATTGLNVGGTAEITMQGGHPAYSYFTGHKTVVTIYRGNVLRFRGRALYAETDSLRQRTIVCEGELCFLRDSINRPYNYVDSSPGKIFRALIRAHNEQVEPFKQFEIGTVTVPGSGVAFKSESAETVLDTLDKLIDRCGGYIVFTTSTEGKRVINYYQTINRRSKQAIEFGENLLDFSSTGANNGSLATGLIPYGAKDEKTKQRITIESVNGGKDYILAEDARAIRGTIMATATFDDATTPEALLTAAQEALAGKKSFITSLELTALDLSYLDKSLDSFAVGDSIPVISEPYALNDVFQLAQMTEDFLNPARSKITLGKDIPSLTGADVAGDFNSQMALAKTADALRTDYAADIQQVAQQAGAQVMDQVAQVYAPQTAMAQLLESLNQEASARAAADLALQTSINNEVTARAGMMNKVNGAVSIGGGTPINMNGRTIDLTAANGIFAHAAINFDNGLGIRIRNSDGASENGYYVLRVDTADSCIVGNDYCNLYLRGKDAVYLYKTGAAVTSDRREKNSIEELPEAYEGLLDKLTPLRFRYNDKGDRYHVGFVAQDVDRALTEAGLSREDFGGFVDLNGDGSHLGLVYDEFVGLLLQKIKKLETRLKVLEEKA